LIGYNIGHQYAQAYTQQKRNKTRAVYKQLGMETNRTSFLCGNQNTELRT